MRFEGFLTESMGVYCIRNTVSGKVYIGRTSNFKRRYRQYLYDFNNDRSRCLNSHMLNAKNKYGIESFVFEPIYYCILEDESLLMEEYFMRKYKSCDRDFGYNIRRDSEGGMITSKETSSKISKRLKLEWANGVRSEHSNKLKMSWVNRDREFQSRKFSETLTKYLYVVDDDFDNPLKYKELCEIGLKSCISAFYRRKSNVVNCKGFKVERVSYEN